MTKSAHQELIRAVEQANSPAQLVAAVRSLAAALAASGRGIDAAAQLAQEAGISTLITALGYNNPAAAVAAVEGLIQLGGLAVQPLIEQLDEYNYGARAYAIRALAAIADPRALDVLLAVAATDFAPSARRAAAKGLGSLCWHQLGAEEREAAQVKVLQTLLSVSEDADWSIRYAAVVGLQGLATLPNLTEQIKTRFEQMTETDVDLAVRARVQLARRNVTGNA